jgi:hypothetical protein
MRDILDQGPDRDEPETTSRFDAQIPKSEMIEIGLKLEISTLKAIVALCR